MRLLLRLIFFSLPFLLYSCKPECEGREARHLYIQFTSSSGKLKTSPYYTAVYGEGNSAHVIPIRADSAMESYKIYLNLHASKVSYIFENDQRKDTITISYATTVEYLNDQCGYQADMEVQAIYCSTLKWSGFHPTSHSWFGPVKMYPDSIIYVQLP